MPFLSSAVLYAVAFPFCTFVLWKERRQRMAKEANLSESARDSPVKQNKESNYDEISFYRLCSNMRFLFGLISQIVVTSSIQFMAPSLAVHLRKYGFSPAFIGVCFAVPGIIYAALSPIMYLFTERLPKRAVILIGIVLMSVGMFFVGTSKTLGMENNPAMIIAGLMIIGAAAGMISIPVLPEMLEVVEDMKDVKYNTEELNNYISSVFVICTGAGEFIGPVLSSLLNDSYGFRGAQDIYANLIMIFGALYFILCGNFAMFVYTQKER